MDLSLQLSMRMLPLEMKLSDRTGDVDSIEDERENAALLLFPYEPVPYRRSKLCETGDGSRELCYYGLCG